MNPEPGGRGAVLRLLEERHHFLVNIDLGALFFQEGSGFATLLQEERRAESEDTVGALTLTQDTSPQR